MKYLLYLRGCELYLYIPFSFQLVRLDDVVEAGTPRYLDVFLMKVALHSQEENVQSLPQIFTVLISGR